MNIYVFKGGEESYSVPILKLALFTQQHGHLSMCEHVGTMHSFSLQYSIPQYEHTITYFPITSMRVKKNYFKCIENVSS